MLPSLLLSLLVPSAHAIAPTLTPMSPERPAALLEPTDPPSTWDSDLAIMAVSGGASTTLEGSLFYHDHRESGLQDWRYDTSGDPGDGTEGQLLGAWYVMIEIYEVDDTWLGWDCHSTEEVASAWVGRDGSFSATFNHTDGCSAESGETPKYTFRARMRYCNSDEFCVEVGPDRGDGYYDSWSDTTTTAAAGTTTNLGFFAWGEDDATDEDSVALNHYASLIDTAYRVHIEQGIPFRYDTYGSLHAWVGTGASDGRATDADLLEIELKETFPEGGKIMHEYGHIVHRRAWGGDYAGYPNPIQSWGPGTREEKFIAFKEGFANFIERWVDGTCDSTSYDDNHAFPDTGSEGLHYVENHHQVLCDMYDARVDYNSTVVGGEGDRMTDDLWSVWSILDGTDNHVDDYGGSDPEVEGLHMCDLVDYDLEIRKSASAVGSTAHDEREWEWSNTLAVNGLSCPGIPTPASLRAYDLDVKLEPLSYTDSLNSAGTGTRNLVARVTVANEHPYQLSDGFTRTVTRTRLGVATTISSTYTASLAAGAEQSSNVTIPISVINNVVQTTTVTLAATVGAYETDASDNTTSITVNAAYFRPNLTVEITDWDQTVVGANSTWTATATLRNDGLTAIGGGGMALTPFMVSLKDPNNAVVDTQLVVGGLGVGASRSVTLSGTSATYLPFVAYLTVTADTGGAITERSETDNTDRVMVSELPFGGEPWSELVWDDSLIEMSILASQIRHDMIEEMLTEPWWEYEIIDPTDMLILEQLREAPQRATWDGLLVEESVLVDPATLQEVDPALQPYVLSLQMLR